MVSWDRTRLRKGTTAETQTLAVIFAMEIHPLIPDRTTEQLLDIVETPEQWRPDVVDLAKSELTKRGIGTKTLETRRTIRTKYNHRIQRVKARATFTTIEKVLIVLLGPILVLFFRDILLFHSGEGYKKKNKQGLFFLLLGVGLWGLILYVYYEVLD